MATTTVGDRLIMLVRSLDLTQGDFANKNWISLNSLSWCIKNERSPDPVHLTELAKQKVNFNRLLSGKGGVIHVS